MTGRRIIMCAVPIHHCITRFQLNILRTGETGNMKVNQPTLLTKVVSNHGSRSDFLAAVASGKGGVSASELAAFNKQNREF